MGCLQYYNGASGMVQSFNYMQDIGTPANLEGVNHLANLNYAACVRMESGYCGIRWSQYPSDAVSFTISGDVIKIFISVLPWLFTDLIFRRREQDDLDHSAGREVGGVW